jgi:plastocyanin
MGSLRAARLAIALVFAGVAIGCDDTMTGPSATPTPAAVTPTPAAAPHAVYVGQSSTGARENVFLDAASGTSTTTIHAGETVQWMWLSGTHSTTSGRCALGCVGDGIWDSGVLSGGSFSHTFPTAGTFPYFCQVHGVMMQGSVVVQ